MKKKHIIIIIIVLLLLLGIFAGFFIYYNNKEKSNFSPNTNEKSNFINANIETNCELSFNSTIKNNPEKLNPILSEKYKKYEFPIEDNETMLFILKKYENDPEINSIIKSFSDKCENGKAIELYIEIAPEKELNEETEQLEKTLN